MEEVIKKEIERQLNSEFEKIKINKLKEINSLFENRKKDVIAGILKGVSIEISRNEFGIEPIINIQIKTTRVIRKEV